MVKESGSLIFTEFNTEDRTNWFDLKEKKFLHQIDTFYYSVKIKNDFTSRSEDPSCLKLRRYFKQKLTKDTYDNYVPFYCNNLDVQLNIRPFCFAKFYNINLECPELFDIFIADSVPVSEDGVTSVTSEIIVQLRSALLWQYGVTKAFEYSYKAVEAVCKHFELTILEVKENRADYCWHSNYLQNPEKFFRIDNFAKMQVSHFKRATFQYEFGPNDEYENDYIALGKRSDKCFVRIYLKSKEVVEKGYKGWFLKEWLLNGLINRYDYYVYEKCYLQHSWYYMDKARLEFYLEYGKNENYKKDIRAILDGVTKPSAESVRDLADKLTPRITLITNVEFQTTRKMSKSFKLIPLKDNEDKGVCSRIYDYIDNHSLITEYLTYSTLRLVDRNSDSNKSRCDCCAFWKVLRSTKLIDAKKAPKELKLIRDYSRNLNSQVVKKRAMSAAVTYGLYTYGINDYSAYEDAANLLCTLNDNDIEIMKRIKDKRIQQLNKQLYADAASEPKERTYAIIDLQTGEYYD